jgi:ribosomal protein S18 acetylase RimI-like enzyme
MEARVSVRAAVHEDADQLANVRVDYAAFHAQLDPSVFRTLDSEEVRRAYAERLALAGELTLVADVGDEVAGLVELKLERPAGLGNIHRALLYGYVEDLAVLERYRRRGVGRQLMLAAEAWAQRQGARSMLLNTHPKNEAALRFYREAMGYETVGVTLRKPV